MRNRKSLVGETITAIWLATDRKAIKFDLANGESVVAMTDGDCCSESWIEAVQTPEVIIGSPVAEAADIEMPDLGNMEGRDVVAYYGYRIATAKGECVIDYRNDSNGYYGGSLEWSGDDFYGGVFGQNQTKYEWERLA